MDGPVGAPVIADFELVRAPAYPWTKGTDWETVINLHDAIAEEAMDRIAALGRGNSFGFYGMFPIDNVLPNAVMNEGDVHPPSEMRAHNDMAAALMARVDVLYPCAYWTGPDGYNEYREEHMASIASEAARVAPGKPVSIFLSPQVQDTINSNYPDLTYAQAKNYFEMAKRHFNRFTMWGGYNIGSPPRSDADGLQLLWPGTSVGWFQALMEVIE